MSGTVGWLASKPYPRGRGEIDLDLPRVVCEYEDVFPDELPGLPPQRVIHATVGVSINKICIIGFLLP